MDVSGRCGLPCLSRGQFS